MGPIKPSYTCPYRQYIEELEACHTPRCTKRDYQRWDQKLATHPYIAEGVVKSGICHLRLPGDRVRTRANNRPTISPRDPYKQVRPDSEENPWGVEVDCVGLVWFPCAH